MAIAVRARRVLVVDDELLIRWSLAEVLAARGYVVAQAATAAEAELLVSTAHGFDVILLDLRLPDSGDLGLLERLRRDSPLSRIIMMTAYGTPEIAERCHRLGVFQFLGKPFHLSEIADLVDAAA